MRWFSKPVALAGLAALLALAACQPMPKPFARDSGAVNPLLALPDSLGVLVLPVDGVSPVEGRILADRMADALLRREIPASTAASNRRSYRLHGRLDGWSGGKGTLVWDLYDHSGKRLGTETQRIDAAERAKPPVKFGDPVAARIVALIQKTGAPPAPPPPVVARKVFVPAVEGAPGDGGRSLQNAMRIALTRVGFSVVDKAEKDAFTVQGRVTMGRTVGPRRAIAIAWSVRHPGGGEVGTIRQRNMVPPAAVQGAWGDMAHAIALNAVDGVRALLRRAAASKPAARNGAAAPPS